MAMGNLQAVERGRTDFMLLLKFVNAIILLSCWYGSGEFSVRERRSTMNVFVVVKYHRRQDVE